MERKKRIASERIAAVLWSLTLLLSVLPVAFAASGSGSVGLRTGLDGSVSIGKGLGVGMGVDADAKAEAKAETPAEEKSFLGLKGQLAGRLISVHGIWASLSAQEKDEVKADVEAVILAKIEAWKARRMAEIEARHESESGAEAAAEARAMMDVEARLKAKDKDSEDDLVKAAADVDATAKASVKRWRLNLAAALNNRADAILRFANGFEAKLEDTTADLEAEGKDVTELKAAVAKLKAEFAAAAELKVRIEAKLQAAEAESKEEYKEVFMDAKALLKEEFVKLKADMRAVKRVIRETVALERGKMVSDVDISGDLEATAHTEATAGADAGAGTEGSS